ncbi:MAG: hypothetical protein ACTSYD_07415 [Candidatus Heimdallarchaeaceae archaeon]
MSETQASSLYTNKNGDITLIHILKLSTISSIASLGIVLSVFVILVPNLEFISISMFLITLLFGIKYGIFSVFAISIVYELIVTPIYGSAGLLFFFKVFSYLLLVISTYLFRHHLLQCSWWELGIFGAFFSLLYDIITTIGGQLIIIQSHITFLYLVSVFIMGTLWTLTHIITNFILFSTSHVLLTWIIQSFEYRGVRWLLLSTTFLQIAYKNKKHVDNCKGDENSEF